MGVKEEKEEDETQGSRLSSGFWETRLVNQN